MDELYDLCFSHSPEKNSTTKAITSFIRLIKLAPPGRLQNLNLKKSLTCAVKILSFSHDVLYTGKKLKWKQRNNYQTIKTFYYHLISTFSAINVDDVISVVISVTHEAKLWQWEDLCHDVIYALISCGINVYKIITVLLSKADSDETSSNEIRKILRILYKMLEDYSWVNDENTEAVIDKLLTLYRSTLIGSQNKKQIILKKGVEISILNIIKHVSNDHLLLIIRHMSEWTLEDDSDDEVILEFSNILESAAELYKVILLEDTLQRELFYLLLKMISSTKPCVSLVGNRVFQHLIDRSKNKSQFHSIRIFFENTNYDIKVNECNRRDQEFLKQHRELIHDSFLQSLVNHCPLRVNLESVYCTICLIAVEVPGGFTAAALACLIMNVQDLTLEQLDANREVSYHVHAVVLAIMTLICWIHRAKVFYAYVNKIVMERAQWAPHLNPPLATHYDFAVHHILWDKPELFFIDWEVRFGLWKCFRLQSEDDYVKSTSSI